MLPLVKVYWATIASHDVVTAQTRQILRNHHVDAAQSNVFKHLLKSRTVEIHAGVSVVDVDLLVRIAHLQAVVDQDRSLRADTDTFSALVIIFRKTKIKSDDVLDVDWHNAHLFLFF